MKTLQSIVSSLWDKALVMMGTLCVLLPTSPINMPYTYRDSGVFLYIGWRILHGELPYRDIWDHKPPVIFYINALGLAITNGSRWGVWLLELVSLFFAAFVGYKMIQKILGTTPALFSTLLWLLTLVFVIQGGNLTTEYTLPLQFVALWFVTTIVEQPTSHYWRWFLTGVIGATAFFTKQTAIGIWLSIILFLVTYRVKLQKIKTLVFELLYFWSGAFSVCAAWVVFFGLQGGLTQFWNAAFEFNFVYTSSAVGLVDRLKLLITEITPLTKAGLLQYAGIGYCIGLILASFNRDRVRPWFPLLVIGLLDLPIELILISTSGRMYPHYSITILPVLALFAGITFQAIFTSQFLYNIPKTATCFLLAGVTGVLMWTSFNEYRLQVISFHKVEQPAILTEIEKHTNPEDRVVVWGAETSINYFSRRQSPSRFVYQYPLYTQGYTNELMITEFLDDLIHKQPKLLIDTHNPRTPLYEFPIQTPLIQQKTAYLQYHYRSVGEIQGWTIYEYTPETCAP